MSGINEKIMDDTEQFMMRFLSAMVGQFKSLSGFAVSAITEHLLKQESIQSLSDKGGEATLKEFQKALKKGEQFTSLRVDDAMVSDYKRFMNEQKVLFVSLDDVETDTHCFMFRNRDLEKMREIKELVDMIHLGETEIPPKTFLNAYDKQNIACLSRLSPEEVELFRYFMKPEKVLFSVVEDQKNSFYLLYEPKDNEAVKNALQRANWALRGNFGTRVKEQVQYRIKGRQSIVQDLEDAQKEFYIVSKTNPKNFVHVSENEVTYYKNEQEISKVYRNDTDFKSTAWDMIESISAPVIFQAQEFSEDIGLRQDMLDRKMSLDEFPSEMIIEEEMNNYNRLRDLASIKMSLDDENQGNWALYVDSVPYSEFSSREEIMDTDEEISRKEEFEKLKRSVKETEKEHAYDEILVEEKSLDYVIAQAEKRVQHEQGQTQSKSMEKESR